MNTPIGIFDSGLGGLTVLRHLLELLPCEDVVYVGDTARLPYGDKSPEAIINNSLEVAEFLTAHKCKLIVVACSTASAYALEHLRAQFSVPIIDAIELAVKRAVRATKSQKIAVIGTRGTIKSNIYAGQIRKYLPAAEVLSIACPLLVPLIEEAFAQHPATRLILRDYLEPLVKESVDVLILGCTHYPMLLPLIKQEFGEQLQIIDSAKALAKAVVEIVEKCGLERYDSLKGTVKYYVSDNAEKFQRLGQNFLGVAIERVETADLRAKNFEKTYQASNANSY